MVSVDALVSVRATRVEHDQGRPMLTSRRAAPRRPCDASTDTKVSAHTKVQCRRGDPSERLLACSTATHPDAPDARRD
jgi:hypothetical protein